MRVIVSLFVPSLTVTSAGFTHASTVGAANEQLVPHSTPIAVSPYTECLTPLPSPFPTVSPSQGEARLKFLERGRGPGTDTPSAWQVASAAVKFCSCANCGYTGTRQSYLVALQLVQG